MTLENRSELGVSSQGVELREPPKVVSQRVVHDSAQQSGTGVTKVHGGLVQIGICIWWPHSASADHNDAIGTELESRCERRATAGGAVDIPPGGFGGLVDMHGGKQDRDRRGGHQVGYVQPGGDEASVVLGRRAR